GLWLGTERGLNRFRDGRIEPLASDTLQGLAVATARAADGTRWVALRDVGLFRLGPDGVTRFDVSDGLLDTEIEALFIHRDGLLWIGTRRGLNLLRNGRIETILDDGQPWSHQVRFIQQDRNGTIWLGTNQGTFFLSGKDIAAFQPQPEPDVLWVGPLLHAP